MAEKQTPIKSKPVKIEMSADERKQVLEELFVFGKANQRPFMKRMAILLIISTVIATGGLLSNSAAVVIGAMLVAPMMRPVMSAAAAITLGWSTRFYQAILMMLAMTVGAVVISMILTAMAPTMIHIPEQVMFRTQPTFFDLVIALASGVGGAYVMTRKESSAIPGVAMAVSLLPPLSSCGILLVFGENDLALKAFTLFATNFLAMTLGGALTFLVVGISPSSSRVKFRKFIRNLLLIFGGAIVIISVPLYFYSDEVWFDDEYHASKSVELQNWLKSNELHLVDIHIDKVEHIAYLTLTGAKAPLTIESLYNTLMEKQKKDGKVVDYSIKIAWIPSVNSSWPPPENIDALSEAPEKEESKQKLGLRNITWGWKHTQYSDDRWLETKNLAIYTFNIKSKDITRIKVSCKNMEASYRLSANLLSFKLPNLEGEECANYELDRTFVNDMNRVVNYKIEGDQLVLQLSNNAGFMYFTQRK